MIPEHVTRKPRIRIVAFTDHWSAFDNRSIPWYLFRTYGRLEPSQCLYRPSWKGLSSKLRMRVILGGVRNPCYL